MLLPGLPIPIINLCRAAIAVLSVIACTASLSTTALADTAREFDLTVAPDGNDAHPGTPEQPLATLYEAQRRVRHRCAAGLNDDLVVRLRGGTYRLHKTLTFTPADGGGDEFAVRYQAWPGESPLLSGAVPAAAWRVETEGEWRTGLPQGILTAPRHVTIGQRRGIRARTPNAGYFHGITTDDGLTLNFPAGIVGGWSRPGEVELVTLVEWSASRAPVPARGVMLTPDQQMRIAFGRQVMLYCFDDWAGHLRDEITNFPFYFENSPELLDAAGEWYADAAAGVLRYRPRAGELPDACQAEFPILEMLIDIRGRSGTPVRNLYFAGITFADTTWLPPAEGYYPVQAGRTKAMAINRGEIVTALPAPAVRLESAQNCRLTNCRFERLGGVGLQIARGCRQVAVRACVFRDIAGCGMEIGEQLSLQPEEEIVTQTSVEDCDITTCGGDNPGVAGISVLICRETKITHNHLHNLPYSGVTCGWNWTHADTVARDNVIAHNHIHHVLLEMADGGGIYTLGNQPGSRIVGNHIHDIQRVRGIAGANGIFMDNGSEGWHLEGNIIYAVADAPVRFNTTDTNETFQTWGKNWLAIPPSAPDFPVLKSRDAGPRH